MSPISKKKLLGNKERWVNILQFKELRSKTQLQGLKQISCLGSPQGFLRSSGGWVGILFFRNDERQRHHLSPKFPSSYSSFSKVTCVFTSGWCHRKKKNQIDLCWKSTIFISCNHNSNYVVITILTWGGISISVHLFSCLSNELKTWYYE